ncbi:hypothetical protein FBEOM_3952 [Fusarium beomiforme]|uniref:Uncharacterized protein n=1 Tax=Fusarium beomiforme TaxID=44412 RepID=A0A9P5ANN7_9HYPO|nr:hypothetical protein FBEOM_3952 [Fusarium beomiforme]
MVATSTTASSLTFLCQGYEFTIPQSVVRAKSPKLSASLDAAQTKSPNPSITVKGFTLDAVNCMVEYFKTEWYEIDRRNFSSVLQAVGGVPAQDGFIRDELAAQLDVSAIGNHYGVPKLCELARDNIQKVFRDSQWDDEVFIFALERALKSKDHKLHKLFSSHAKGHLASLTNSSEFDLATFLKSFHSTLRDTNDVHQKTEVAAQKAPIETSIELQSLRSQAASAQIEELRQSVATITAERDVLWQQANDVKGIAPADAKQDEQARSIEALERELRVSRSDCGLLRTKWQREKTKTSLLTLEKSDIQKDLELEKRSKGRASEVARDDLRNALKDEQKATKGLTAKLGQATKNLETEKKRSATVGQELTQAKTNLELEKQKMAGFCLDGDVKNPRSIFSLTKELNEARKERNIERDKKWKAHNKMKALLRAINEWSECRQCGADFATYIEEQEGTLVLRCSYCTTRHTV